MKININGITRDMTPEEIAEYERMMAEVPQPEPSDSELLRAAMERIRQLENQLYTNI